MTHRLSEPSTVLFTLLAIATAACSGGESTSGGAPSASAASADARTSGGGPAAPKELVDACKDPKAVRVGPDGKDWGVCVVLPASFKEGVKDLGRTPWGGEKFVGSSGALIGGVSWSVKPFSAADQSINTLTSAKDATVVSKGDLGRPNNKHVHIKSSSDAHQYNAYLQSGTVHFFCWTNALAPLAADLEAFCSSMTAFGPAPDITADAK